MQIGFMTRAFTVFVEVNDPYAWLMVTLNTVLNSITLLQFGYYYIKSYLFKRFCPLKYNLIQQSISNVSDEPHKN